MIAAIYHLCLLRLQLLLLPLPPLLWQAYATAATLPRSVSLGSLGVWWCLPLSTLTNQHLPHTVARMWCC
jgi:hypothetical protein